MTPQLVILCLSLIPLGLASWQDMRTRHVSNWITIPLFFLAWPLAWWMHGWQGVAVTGVTFLATYAALPFGFGAADGKLIVYLAAVGGGGTVLLALGLNGLFFLLARLFPEYAGRLPWVYREEDGVHVAGGVGIFLTDMVVMLLFFILKIAGHIESVT